MFPVFSALVPLSVGSIALIFAAEILFKLIFSLRFSRPVPSSGDNDLLTSAIEMLLTPHRLRNASGVLSDHLVSSGLSQAIEMHNASRNWDNHIRILASFLVT
jgi:energy-coupling factor transporter transmembrane protein EcfT